MTRFLLLASISILLPLYARASEVLVDERATAAESTPRIILRIKVNYVVMTPFYPSSSCPKSESCLPFNFWYRYKAEVKGVAMGHWHDKTVTFLNLQHATFIRKLTDDCYVVLVPTGSDLKKKVAVPFVAEQLLFPSVSTDAAKIEVLRGMSRP